MAGMRRSPGSTDVAGGNVEHEEVTGYPNSPLEQDADFHPHAVALHDADGTKSVSSRGLVNYNPDHEVRELQYPMPSPSNLPILARQLALREQFLDQQHFETRPTYLSMNLDVSSIVSESYGSDPGSLWDTVVLVGNHSSRWAGSIAEYVTKMWPDSVERIKACFEVLSKANTEQSLDADQDRILLREGNDHELEKAFITNSPDELQLGPSNILEPNSQTSLGTSQNQSNVQGDSFTTFSAIMTAEEGSSNRKTIIRMTGSPQLQVGLIEALAWLQVVLTNAMADRNHPFDCDVALTKVASTSSGSIYELNVTPLPEIRPYPIDSCWVWLLPKTACATTFLSTWRPQSIFGLEVTFDLMCILTGARYEIDHGGGVILYGDHALIFPRYIIGDCVQWHFELCSPNQSPHEYISGQRLLHKDLDEIRNFQRHFVGLWSEPEVTLGTESLEYHKLRFSRAEQVSETLTKDNVMVGGSISLPRILSLSGSVSYKFLSTRKTHFMRGSIIDNLYSKIASPVMLYSPHEKRAWLVSYVSVVLHLSRCRAATRAELNHRMPACDVRANGGRAAWECIKRCHNDHLKVMDEDEIPTELEKATKIEHHIQEVIDCIELTRRTRGRAIGLFRDRILGYELADIARFKDSMIMKKCNLEYAEGWGPLLDSIELVFFYEGLADPIVPSPGLKSSWADMGLCGSTMWHEIPKGFNLLTASLPCLRYLAEKWGEYADGSLSRVAREHTWFCPMKQGPFSVCNKQPKCTCNRLQEVRRAAMDSCLPKGFFEDHTDGAVVFNFDAKPEDVRASVRAANKRRTSSNNSLVPVDSGYWSGSARGDSLVSFTTMDNSVTTMSDEGETLPTMSDLTIPESEVSSASPHERINSSRAERLSPPQSPPNQPTAQPDFSEAVVGSPEDDKAVEQGQLVKINRTTSSDITKSPTISSEAQTSHKSDSRKRHRRKKASKDMDEEPKTSKNTRGRTASSNTLARWMLPIRHG